MRYLVIDSSNIIHKSFYANQSEDDITLAGVATHSALLTLNKYFKLYKPDKIILAFDRPSWRLEYTKSDKCISGKIYKAGRRKNQTEKQKQKYKLFQEHIKDFENMVTDHTSIITLASDGLEADDLISGCVQLLTLEEDNEVIIISADKDFMQLLRYDNVYLVDPATGDERTLQDYNNDADFFMFEKCIRGEGEGGDNVQSAKPNIRKTKIVEAYNDEFVRTNLMETKWKHPISKKKFIVGELFKENDLLMNLESQPDEIMEQIINEVQRGLANPGNFNHFKFIKFCQKFGLVKVQEGVNNYIKMLSS